jgi:TolB-like protein/class 3 adenylate cyclase/Tfp pilus assembly protein PilF
MAREQRKLAAILAADVVGYSRLMGRDESGTLARLRDHRKERLEPSLARYGGRLVKLMGDGAMAEFPSAVDALSAAISFQQAIAEANRDQPVDTAIVFRIGLHLGDLIVEDDDLYGDGVNVAARLEAEAPPGGIVVSRTVHEAVAGRLKATFEDLGNLQLKNIERSVQAYSARWQPEDWLLSASHYATAASAGASQMPLPLPDKPSIAVLPFQNMSGDPEQEYFADGMVEDIITALSRDRGLFVIARNSSFTYKGRPVDVRQVGRELGVRYVLEGSVRKAGNKVRITGQLIEAKTGSHLWADRFDGGLEDVFELQNQVANKVASIISPAVELAEIERATRKTENLQAYDLFLRAKASFNRLLPKDFDQALGLAEQSLTLDPTFARCHALVAAIFNGRVASSVTRDAAADAAAAEHAARKAFSLDGNDATIVMQYGQVLAQSLGRYEEGISLFDKAIELDPNLAIAWAWRGLCKGGHGKTDEAIRDLQHALRLSPRDPRAWMVHHGLSWAHLIAGRYDEAVSWATAVLQFQPNFAISLRIVIAAHAYAERLDKAREVLATHMMIEPETRISTMWDSYGRRMPREVFETFANGLRKAGFPE